MLFGEPQRKSKHQTIRESPTEGKPRILISKRRAESLFIFNPAHRKTDAPVNLTADQIKVGTGQSSNDHASAAVYT